MCREASWLNTEVLAAPIVNQRDQGLRPLELGDQACWPCAVCGALPSLAASADGLFHGHA